MLHCAEVLAKNAFVARRNLFFYLSVFSEFVLFREGRERETYIGYHELKIQLSVAKFNLFPHIEDYIFFLAAQKMSKFALI